MKPANCIVLLSDEHNRDVSGCYGHPMVQTPNIDRLAERGTRFTNAYTNCPICVPARASMATGRYVHQIGNWDNGFPYDGSDRSWHRELRDRGIRVDSIGKLHFRAVGEDHGFTEEIDALQVVDGVGDILGCLRDDPPQRHKRSGIEEAGPGDSSYLRYDVSNADRACGWIADHSADANPWVLFVGFVLPHPPYIAPPDLFDSYPIDDIELPPQWESSQWPDHPALAHLRWMFDYQEPFTEEIIRRLHAAYYGACTHLDRQIGRVIDAVEECGIAESTRLIYTSDHGESLGARGLVGKFTMYDESAAVPMILAGPDVPSGISRSTPVSLVDLFPTLLESVGASSEDGEDKRPGESLWRIATESDRDRIVFSEYHAVGSRRGYFMVRDARYKLVYYVNESPQLFDLVDDPGELIDRSADERFREVRTRLEAKLQRIVDPEAVDARARSDQAAVVERHGGREMVVARGAFDNSPVPGDEAIFHL